MRRSTKKEMQEVKNLISATLAQINGLIQSGKKVHIIWDFDGILADSMSNDVAALADPTGSNLAAYFAYEERLLFEIPGEGLLSHTVAYIML